jgi:hypothetical protein
MTVGQSSKPLKLWWWDRKNNYGDILNPHIVSYVSGRDVVWAMAKDADMIAIGSVMDMVEKRVLDDGAPIYVWGAGMKEPESMDILSKAALMLVRGPLTATMLKIDDLPQGDPGLLVNEAMDVSTTRKTHQYGIIPHWLHNDVADIARLQETLPNARIINMISDDVHKTTKAIASCDVVLSSSLHGLIVADSLGIPNIWIDAGAISKSSRFKFFDYALSVGRAMAAPYKIKPLLASGLPEVDVNYFSNLPAIKDTIRNAFPLELMAC